MKDEKAFVDTNILVYAYDNSAGEKHRIAAELLLKLWDSGLGVVSSQVLQEFFVTVTRKISSPIDFPTAKNIVSDLLKWETVLPDGKILLDAIDLQQRYNFSFWDCMILSAAITARAQILLSEDLQPGIKIGPLSIVNPFREAS